jgi:ferredoxin
MALIITKECINCDACIRECPNNAIYEPDFKWAFSDGTSLKGLVKNLEGIEIMAEEKHEPISEDIYYIAYDKCTGCKGFFDKPKCVAICPAHCCVPDENHIETEEQLLEKKAWLHNE